MNIRYNLHNQIFEILFIAIRRSQKKHSPWCYVDLNRLSEEESLMYIYVKTYKLLSAYCSRETTDVDYQFCRNGDRETAQHSIMKYR